MSYAENTVGWFLNTLKEPLRTRAMKEAIKYGFLAEPCNSMVNALWCIARATPGLDDRSRFWIGASDFYEGLGRNDLGDIAKEGWDMAKDCAPDAPESPAPGKDQRIFINGLDFDVPRPKIEGGDYLVAQNQPLVVTPAVVGYTPPKHIETIEERHDREIRELQARGRSLHGQSHVEAKVANIEIEINQLRKSKEALEARVSEQQEQIQRLVGKVNELIEICDIHTHDWMNNFNQRNTNDFEKIERL
jgi:hypothetical protein